MVTPLIAFVVTPLAIFVVVENWRGNRAWRAMQDELKARGEPLQWSAYQPPPIPDERNFFKGPAAARMLDLFGHSSPEAEKFLRDIRLDRFFEVHLGSGPVDWGAAIGELKTAGLLAKDYTGSPAAGVLLALLPAQPFLDELRDAAITRTDAIRPPTTNPLLFFTGVSTAVFQPVRALGVRAQAKLELGQNEEAFGDTIALAHIARHLAVRPTMFLNLMFAGHAQALAVDAISQGCRRHAWTDAQLVEFEKQLSRFDVFGRFRECLRTEQVVVSYVLDSPPLPKNIDPTPRPWWLFHGWLQQNKVAWGHHIERDLLPAFAANPGRVFLNQIERLRQTSKALQGARSPYEWGSRLGLGNYGNAILSLGQQVEKAQQSILFCALERFRLAHGRYPDQLDQLAPTFLSAVPPDVFTGQPRRYLKLPSGGHQLYSVGKNGRDDGGQDDDIVLKLPDA